MGKTLGYGEITVANMTEPFTVMLTNEAQQFATDSNRKVTSAQSYYTDIIVIRGSQERTDYTIGNITSGSGITVSKNSKRVTFSVSAGTTIGADAGVIEIPITLDGQTVKKQFSWSCGKQGPQGVKGNDGNSFAWNMLSETNCGKKHWGTESSGGKYSVEDFITEDNIDAVKLICTEAISTSNWSYVSFKDIKMLKQLKPSTKYTLSYDIKANRSGAISHSICKGDVSNFCTNTVVVNNIIGNETWQHISVVLTTNDLKTTPTNEILYLGRNALSKVGYSIIKNLKLVEGDIDTPWSPSQSDIEGKGVVETVQYYLATSQASGVTSSTSGWSTDITTQKLTADKKYLWNCYQTKYSDGTSEPISTPKVIGVYGDKGQNAKNLSITPSSQYFKSTDGGKTFAPNTITIRPTIQGEISFGKWQYSIDGGVSFADVVSGQKGLTISNNVLTVSKDSSLYSDAVTMVTFRAVASDSSFYDTCSIAKIYDVSDIGDGRNLIQKSQLNPIDGAELSLDDYTKNGTVIFTNKSKNSGFSFDSYNNYQPNSKYVLSYYFTKTSGTINSFGGFHNGKRVVYTSFFVDDKVYDTASYAGGSSQIGTILNDGKRHRIVVCYTTPDTIATDTSVNYTFIQPGRGNTNPNFGVKIEELKLEKGSSPTGWSPAPEDVQTAILSTKSEIADVSLKVDKNKQAIEQRVEKTTYQQDLNLVKGDISKANEGLNKWRYEIYPKSLFNSTDQGKSTMDVFAKNTNLTPSQSVLINDMDLSIAWNYDNNYIGYALTFAKFSAAKSVAITFAHDDGAHIYLNGKLIGGSDAYSKTGESLTLGFVKGWNCIEVVVNEGASTEGFKLGTTISAISECQLMNCYYGTPVARQSHITNQLVENTTNIEGVTTTMQKVMTTVGGSDRIDEFVNNYNKTIESEKQFKKTIGETYTTKDEFNGLEIGGRNLLTKDDCNMSKWQNLYPVHCKVTNNDYSNHIDYVPTGGEWEIIYKKISVTKGQKYILSFDYKVNKVYNYLSGQKYGVYLSTSVPANAAPANIITNGQYAIENTVTNIKRGMITFTAPIDTLYIVINGGCIDDNQTGLSFEFNKWKLEKGNKATDWTPAPEDDEINGQNLVSNLPSNWEQGTVTEGSAIGTTYANTKSSSAGSIRPKELIPVSGDITISIAYSNQSKKPVRHWIAAYDVNKNYLGNNYVSNAWNNFPRTLNMKDAKYIAIMVGYTDSSAITPSDISQICLKIERGTSATPFTLAPEDVNGKIVNVETIANQTAKKFEWIVKGGDSSSNFTLTDRVADLVAERINFNGLVKFSGLAKSTQDKINSPTSGNLITISPTNPTSNYGNITFSIVSDDVGGRCIQTTAQFVPFTNYASNIFKPGEQIYYNINVPNWSSTTFDANLGIWFFTAEKKCVANSCTRVTLQRTTWNRLSGYITVPTSGWSGIIYYVIGIENPNKYQLGLVSNSYIEKTTSYATTYASSAVNWVTNNGSSTTSLNSMVKKWTDGAVSDTTQINGGWIKANTITASKIALADFTNYSQLTRDTADAYGFTVTDDTDGTWFSTKNIKRDQFISEIFPCNGGESYLIEYDISTNAKGANNSTDTKNYIGVAIGVYGYTGTVGSNGLPNKATNIWYADRITGSETAPSIHVKTTITTSTATKQFRVFLQSNGYYFEGTTKIRNLSVRRMYGGTLIVDGSITADKIATDAIKSRNYISSGGTQGSFLNLSDGSFQSPNLSWDANGNLIAKNANLSGEITATNGSIAGWTIISNKMYTTGSGKYTGIGKYGSAYAFWAGATSNDNGNSAVFKVGHTGKLTATDADITGTITATNGKIGRYDITSTYLMTNSGSNASGIGGNQAFWAGAEDSNSAPFRVGYDGVLWAENAAIRGSIETGNLGDEGDTVSIINGHIGIQGTSNNVEIYSTGFKFGIDGDYYLMSVSEGVKCYRNLYATDFVADGWLYCSEVHSSGAVVIGADSESFYWAHGYQIARGTSWGGVCVGDDSQQLRLYGSSIWASHSISTSDENLKENFTTLDQYENFYMNLNPIGFNYIGDYDGKKTHFGFGAHKTENVLESEGYDADKFAVVTHRPLVQEDIEKRFGKDVEVDIETEYGVSYTEFIALNTHMIQKTRRELTKVKQEKADLEVRLQAIEAKLGL
ncbi:MAG: tail fiber domain-containing protein [Anaerostipes hadrus]